MRKTKLTAQFLIVLFALVTLTATNVYAQKFLTLKKGTTTVRATIGATQSATWNFSGSQFTTLSIKQRGREPFRYVIRRNGEFLSSGHTTGVIRLESDGTSTYSVTIMNDNVEGRARRVILGYTQSGGDPTV